MAPCASLVPTTLALPRPALCASPSPPLTVDASASSAKSPPTTAPPGTSATISSTFPKSELHEKGAPERAPLNSTSILETQPHSELRLERNTHRPCAAESTAEQRLRLTRQFFCRRTIREIVHWNRRLLSTKAIRHVYKRVAEI